MMEYSLYPAKPLRQSTSGFALIASLSIMAVLVLIGVALFSLSSVATKSAAIAAARTEAQANARMAMMIALGELQEEMGPDQRISANGSIFDTDSNTDTIEDVNHPHWVGSWDSWIAGDIPTTVADPSVHNLSEHQTIGTPTVESMSPAYDRKSDYFRKWLVSIDDPTDAIRSDPTAATTFDLQGDITPNGDSNAVRLVGEGSLGPNPRPEDYVNAGLLQISSINSSPLGRYAWWVADESQKVTLPTEPDEAFSDLNEAEKVFRTQAPDSPGITFLPTFENISDQSQLSKLSTLKNLDLISPVIDATEAQRSQQNFHDATIYNLGIIADVREGGLKRDLSTLLERAIDKTEKNDEFMLYKFDVKDAWANASSYDLPDTPQECVPIQDLAAYYQLYDRGRMAGIEYNDNGTVQVETPDYGTTSNYTYDTDYTTLYRNPVPIKIQFVISLFAEPVEPGDLNYIHNRNNAPDFPVNHFIDPNAWKLRISVNPAVTMWNPYNVPIEMQSGANCQMMRLKPPSIYFTYRKFDSNGNQVYNQSLNLPWAIKGSSLNGGVEGRTDLFRLNFGYTSGTIRFEPGQVKTFSMPPTVDSVYPITGNEYGDTNSPFNTQDATLGWFSNNQLLLMNSSNRPNFNPLYDDYLADTTGTGTLDYPNREHLVYESDGRASLAIHSGETLEFTFAAENTSSGPRLARNMSPTGSAMTYAMVQRNIVLSYNHLNLRHLGLITRTGTLDGETYPGSFIETLMQQGTPDGNVTFPLEAIDVDDIISAAQSQAPTPLAQFSMMVGSETSDASAASNVGIKGRKFPSRPFLHSSALQPVVIDAESPEAAYIHGWNWWMDELPSSLNSLVEIDADFNGYYGGGYDSQRGTTHVIQQEIPVVPPISMAALSHARIGGFSIAEDIPVGEGLNHASQMEGYGPNMGKGGADNPSLTLGFQRVTATGQGGLFPHTLQAIGNSYAHPNLSADKAFDLEWERNYDEEDGERDVVFADHSYLANKSLWDEFFFSSITPEVPFQSLNGSARTAQEVAEDFLTGDIALPNRRVVPYTENLDQSEFSALNTTSQHAQFIDGFADKIAQHLMIEGIFNVNSTSVEAWEALFSSLGGKAVAYLDESGAPTDNITPDNLTPVGGAALPGAQPSSTITSENSPSEQWQGWRYLEDSEIEQLAYAMVEQVKKRGPFLSLSEFVNRRLVPNTDPTNIELALKGALQAALDDESVTVAEQPPQEVTINENFRDSARILDLETAGLSYAFNEAAQGPIAYGSAAYIDQADVLRHVGNQLSVRGDTYVIRTYGDSLDAQGNVIARAWCEATIQRVPDYTDTTDDNHEKFVDLDSPANRRFGRKFIISDFRWLQQDDI